MRPCLFSGSLSDLSKTLGVSGESLEELDGIRTGLLDAGLADWCVLDTGIVRGLAYYTGTVFEIFDVKGAERAIAGGGRYDKLVGTLRRPADTGLWIRHG